MLGRIAIAAPRRCISRVKSGALRAVYPPFSRRSKSQAKISLSGKCSHFASANGSCVLGNASNAMRDGSGIRALSLATTRSSRSHVNLGGVSKEWLLRDMSTLHGYILPWSQVFRITRGRNPWNTLDDERETRNRRAPAPSASSWPRSPRNLVHNWGRRPCKISILIRKSATAARIVG